MSPNPFPQIMGILNLTPDSFSDGGRFASKDRACEAALQMIEDGAHIIDVGGESTRPQALAISIQEELDRVIPVIQQLRHQSLIPISVDTTKAKVASRALEAGATMINDVSGLTADPEMKHLVKQAQCQVVIMHSRGTPQTMDMRASYDDVIQTVYGELLLRIQSALDSGIRKEQIIIDPGFGFAKNTNHNLGLLQRLEVFKSMGLPLMVGLSRKRFIGEITNQDEPSKRVIGSVAANMLALIKGATILRVHDVKETAQMVRMFCAWQGGGKNYEKTLRH